MITILASTVLTCLSLTAVDGDTVRCDSERLRDIGPGAPNKSGYDTPEIGRAECAKERLLGEQAKLRMQELLDQPGLVIEDSGKRDRYGRPLVWIRLGNGKTAGEMLISEGYAVRWEPGYQASWCE